jgi:hypothetical protein
MIEQDKVNEEIEITPDQPQEQERQDVVVEVTGIQIELIKDKLWHQRIHPV